MNLHELVCVYDEAKAVALEKQLSGSKKSSNGMDGLIACATLRKRKYCAAGRCWHDRYPSVIKQSKQKDIAFANKETLVTAGHIIMPLVEKMGVAFLPVDSEHAAIFQCLNGEHHSEIEKIILTASGGPFRGKKRKDLEDVTVEDALKHPNWSMGNKITIDSSTMVNKGLEVIEAKWLLMLAFDQIGSCITATKYYSFHGRI